MFETPKNTIEFRLTGRFAMFTDPLTRVGGEKCSYHIPTYEAIKGALKSIYWKPTLIWVVDAVRVMRRIRTQTKGVKPLDYVRGGNSLAIYTFLTSDPDPVTGVPLLEYQVRAHFEWNLHRPELAHDRLDGKHFAMAKRSLERGGRQDIFLGTRDCQGYAEPCGFGTGSGDYDGKGELGFGLMFHSFEYPDESGESVLKARFWRPIMMDGVIRFPNPVPVDFPVKEIRPMVAKRFAESRNFRPVAAEAAEPGVFE